MSDETHPVQAHHRNTREGSRIPKAVALAAYEVYCELYGAQPALVDLEGQGCRGGFGVNELVAFLYARGFPKAEWRARADEAIRGIVNL